MGAKGKKKVAPTDHTSEVIDTDILIDATRGIVDAVAFLANQQGSGIQISTISAMELVVGCRNKTELNQLQQFLQECTVLPVTTTASQIAYQLMEIFFLSHGLLMPDALIAATVKERGQILYTKNVRHFDMIPGLTVVRPY